MNAPSLSGSGLAPFPHVGGGLVGLVDHDSAVTGRRVRINSDVDRFWVASIVSEDVRSALNLDVGSLLEGHALRVRGMEKRFRAKVRGTDPVDDPARGGSAITDARLFQAGFTRRSLAAIRRLVAASASEVPVAIAGLIACAMRTVPIALLGAPGGGREAAEPEAGPPGEYKRVIEALVLCWKHGLLAFPLGCVWHARHIGQNAIPEPTRLLYGDAVEFLSSAHKASTKNSKYFTPALYLVGLGLVEPGDIDAGYVRYTASALFQRDVPEIWARKGGNRKLDSLITMQKAWYSNVPARLAAMPQSYRGTIAAARNDQLRSDPDFAWARTASGARERVGAWADAAAAYVASLPNRVYVKGDVTSLNVLLDYVIANEDVPANPIDLCRRETVVGLSFAAYVAKVKEGTEKAGPRALAKARDFFDWLLNERATDEDGLRRGFRNPVSDNDISPEPPRNGQTFREAIPYRFLRMMREIIEAPGPGLAPGDLDYDPEPFFWPRQIVADYFPWYNPDTGRIERTWSPVRAYLYLLRLMLPLRELQVRLLDSGEGDPKVFRPEVGGWIDNVGPFAPKSGARSEPQGFLRELWDSERGISFNGLYVTTNKTQDRALGFEDSGYTIPWGGTDDEIVSLFCRLRDWQEKYNPAQRPLSRAELQDPNLQAAPETAARLTPYYFLFRDPANKQKPGEPVTSGRCGLFWRALVEELERRLDREGVTNDDGSRISLVTSTDPYGAPRSVRWDPHTLRVSGLTALQQAGVPIHILSEFVAGHATILMTLYYVKPSTGEINRVLDEAAARMRETEAQAFASWLKSAPPDMLQDLVAFNDQAGLAQAREGQSSLWAPLDDGICPNGGSMCHRGGDELVHIRRRTSREAVYGPVEGGPRNCPRCRYFVTGPAFLAGLVAKFNATAGLIREKLRALMAAEERRRALSEQVARLPGAALDPALQKRLRRADEAVQQFQADSVVLRNTWMAQLRLITRVEAISRARRDSPEPGHALVLNGEMADLRVALHECSEFALWDRICQTYEFYPTVDARLPALRRGNLFDAMLAREGRPAAFATLSDEQILDVGNAAADFLRARLGDAVVDDVMAGRSTMRQLGVLDDFEAIARAASVTGPIRAALPLNAVEHRHGLMGQVAVAPAIAADPAATTEPISFEEAEHA